MSNRPLTVTITLVFILLNVLIWLVLGIVIAINAHPALPVPPLMKGTMAFLSIVIAGILAALFFFIRKRNRIAYILILAFFVFTALLTFFDDVGWSDLVVLVINIVPIVLLIKDRTWYLQGASQI